MGRKERPVRYGPVIDELKARGIAHEQAYLAHLERQGLVVARSASDDESASAGLERTLEAMRAGADVIYQAALSDGDWSGRADFLCKVDRPSDLGDWSYEVTDTKLARDTRAGTVLQLCVYSYLLEKLQGCRPAFMHVVTPRNDFAPSSYRIDDYSAYFRLLERDIGRFVRAPEETYPELVPHCDLCAWWKECEQRRRGDDHLCYVAGISSGQIKSLRALGIDRLADFARTDEIQDPPHGSREALERVREQARVQLVGRERGSPYHELLEPFGTDHGLALLPAPAPEDIFLDFEGDHFAEEGVQEYLTGFVSSDPNGEPIYTALWARKLDEERRAFERFIDFAIETRRRNPQAHIYHFGAYEPAALKRMMGRFATREVELDELLRGGAFVDLHRIVRRALIAGVERYSIKDLEPFFGYRRGQDLAEASLSRQIIEHAIEAGDFDDTTESHLAIVEDYNREDCESAERLRDWLEALRAEAIAQGHALPRPEPVDGEAPEDISELDRELQRLRDGLLAGVPDDPAARTDEQQVRFVLAHMMEFHRREDKAGWWEFYRLREADPESFAGERRAAIGLQFAGVVEAGKAPLQRYRLPAQELDARSGDDVHDPEGNRLGTVSAVDFGGRTLDIKKSKRTADIHSDAVFFHNHVSSKELQKSLMRLGDFVLANGLTKEAPYESAVSVLLRHAPAVPSGAKTLQTAGETTVAAACRIAAKLDGGVLAIQGPPGTGKTYTGAHIICALKRQGLKVGVSAVSHKVILNLLEGAAKLASDDGIDLRVMHKQSGEYTGDLDIAYVNGYPKILAALEDGDADVVGGTAWTWSRPEFIDSVDVLIVDEAGQMSLGNVLACCGAGKSLILLGDPQQLEQPLQSSHPEGSEVSALYHYLDGEDTMPLDRGLFLAETWRLHPAIARFTSEAYYQGKVTARPGLEQQTILPAPGRALSVSGSGLRYLPVRHEGNQARSLEEADAIRNLVAELFEAGSWQDRDRNVSRLTGKDILIVAPYNAQVAALAEALPDLRGRIGTVDRFQGQEAPIVIYSMTSSSPDDAPRGMEFLYDRHRFNVATSRAKALCILVGSPALFEPECRTPRQMRRANGFCRYLELAETVRNRLD